MVDKIKRIIRKVNTTFGIGYGVDALIVRSPLKFLQDTIEAERYIEGVVVSAMYLERYGVDELKKYFILKKVPLDPLNLDELYLSKIIDWLCGFGIIKPHIKGWMDEVRKERNSIVHELRSPDMLDTDKANDIIYKAIQCLNFLGVK